LLHRLLSLGREHRSASCSHIGTPAQAGFLKKQSTVRLTQNFLGSGFLASGAYNLYISQQAVFGL
jgi:hypothetical protein